MRLIDADELKKKVYMEEDPYGETKMVVLETDVDEAPTIDALHVVRCKDCKWWKTIHIRHNVECKVCVKEAYEPIRYEDDYCSRGERRDEGETH